jgi:hypoxanthine phosphoribosyltransferase
MAKSAKVIYQKLGKILVSRKRIRQAVRRIGRCINRDYADKDVILVTNLKGSFRFLSDLLSFIRIPTRIDFISMRSYTGTERDGDEVWIEKDLSLDIHGKDVIIVEDIVDTGLTLDYIVRYFKDLSSHSD